MIAVRNPDRLHSESDNEKYMENEIEMEPVRDPQSGMDQRLTEYQRDADLSEHIEQNVESTDCTVVDQ